MKDDKICFRVIGNLSLIPEDICKLKAEVIIITRENNRMFVNYAIAYTCKYNYNKLYLCLHLILYIMLSLRLGSGLSAQSHHPFLCYLLVLCLVNS